MKLRVNGIQVPAGARDTEAADTREQLNLVAGPGVTLAGSDEHIDGPADEFKVTVDVPGPVAPSSHVLATNVGLGPEHTMSGAAANQCLRASSSSAAAFSTGDLDNNARVEVSLNGTPVAKRREIDFNDTAEILWQITDSAINERVGIVPILYRAFVPLTADVASTASTAFQNITGLSFPMTAGVNYRVYAMLLYTASANTIGLRVSYTGPAMTHQVYHTRVMPPGTTGGVPAAGTDNFWDQVQIAADTGTTSQASVSTSTGNLLIFEGIFRPSANGTFQLRFAPETATASGIVIEAGSSLEWW